jgi:hypothetical protein
VGDVLRYFARSPDWFDLYSIMQIARLDLNKTGRKKAGDTLQRLGGCGEQDGIDDGLIVESDLGDRRRHGEDDVEVRHRQQLGLSVGQTRLWSTVKPGGGGL